MTAFRISFLYTDYSLVTFTNLVTDYLYTIKQTNVKSMAREHLNWGIQDNTRTGGFRTTQGMQNKR
jgi:hypothetical protein